MIIHKKRLKLNDKPYMYIKTACKFKILKIGQFFSSFDTTCSKNPHEIYYSSSSLIKFISYIFHIVYD